LARAHQNWTVEDWKNVAWSDESRFLLRHSDGRVGMWRKQNENMDNLLLKYSHLTTIIFENTMQVYNVLTKCKDVAYLISFT